MLTFIGEFFPEDENLQMSILSEDENPQIEWSQIFDERAIICLTWHVIVDL